MEETEKIKSLDELSQLIQDDLDTLLEGFDVAALENNSGQSLVSLACQIVVDRINEAKTPETPIERHPGLCLAEAIALLRAEAKQADQNDKNLIAAINREIETLMITWSAIDSGDRIRKAK